MKIYLNGKESHIDCVTLQHLWEIEQAERALVSARGFAIALNRAIVPKSKWKTTPITAGDSIEIVRATSGG